MATSSKIGSSTRTTIPGNVDSMPGNVTPPRSMAGRKQNIPDFLKGHLTDFYKAYPFFIGAAANAVEHKLVGDGP